MQRFLILVLLITLSYSSYSQSISGKIIDENNNPIPNVNVYQMGSSKGTISNLNGVFYLDLEKDKSEVFFQCVGFKTKELKVDYTKKVKDIKLVMSEEVITLPEFRVLGTGEDPAYYVMRKVIAMAPYYSNQLSQYDCKVYLKGSYVIENIPWLFRSTAKEDGIIVGRTYVTEAINKVHFELPNKVTQQVVAIRSSEGDEQTSPMGMITNNLYNSDEYGIACPLGTKAFANYKFKLEGTFKEMGQLVNKIRVIPRNNGKGLFDGYLYIFDGLWSLHSANLKMKLPMMDVTMKQIYGFVEDGVWMPKSFGFNLKASAMGFKAKAAYTASISEYKVVKNEGVDHSLLARINGDVENINKMLAKSSDTKLVTSNKPLSKEQEKINKIMEKDELSNADMRRLNRLIKKETKRIEPIKPLEVKSNIKMAKVNIKNDSVFWANSRPIKLTEGEKTSFVSKDSIQKIIHTKEYKDSILVKQRRFKFDNILWGKEYLYKNDSARYSSSLSVPGIFEFSNISFNTVDGFNMDIPFSYSLHDTLGKSLYAKTMFNYAEAREALSFKSSISYMFDGIKMSTISIGGGIYTKDFKGSKGESSMENMVYSLMFEKNFKKYYEERNGYIQYSTEISNGLISSFMLSHTKRLPLENNSNFKIIDDNSREYSSNIPILDKDIDYSESNQNLFALMFEYTPRQYYRIKNNRKSYLYKESPTYTLKYSKAFTMFNGDADYDYLELGISQTVNIPFSNSFDYNFKAGKFLSSSKLYAQDFRYFNSFKEPVSLSSNNSRFGGLSYYEAFSKDYFVEGHLNYTMNKFILKRLPLVNNAMMLQESIFVNYLNTESLKNYFELGYGLNNIFLLLDAQLVAGFKKGEMDYLGAKFIIKLK